MNFNFSVRYVVYVRVCKKFFETVLGNFDNKPLSCC